MSSIRFIRALRARRAGRDEGLTLVELLVAIVLLAGITSGVAAAFALTVKTSSSATDRIKKSNDAQAISNFLVQDAASAGAYGADNRAVTDPGGLGIAPGVLLGTASTGFCPDAGGAPAVRFEWIERTASATVSQRVAANYVQVESTLVRHGCTQTFDTRTGATTAPASISTATLARSVATVTGACDPGCTSAFRMPNTVTITVTTTVLADDPLSAYTYSVSGSLRVGQLDAGDASNPSSQILSLLALGAEEAPCPAPTSPRSSGLAISSSNDRLKIFGAAAINATTDADCGPARMINGQMSATETLSLTGTGCNGSGCSTGNPRSMGAPIPDPYRDLEDPPGAASCGGGTNPGSVAPNTLGPGVYPQQLNLTQFASTVYFRPGIYILCNGLVAGANLQLSTIAFGPDQAGSLFYLAGGTITIDSSAQVALRGLAAGPYKDLLIWQTRSTAQGGDITLTTGVDFFFFFTFNASYRGVVYAPDAQVRVVDGSHVLGFRQLEATVDTIVARNVYIGGSVSWATGDTSVRMGPGPATTTALTLSKNPFAYGEAVTMTAQVSRVAPSTASDGAITGSITFMSDGEPLLQSNGQPASFPVNGSGGASFTTSTLEGGTFALTAAYSGDGTYSSSISPPIGTTVDRVPSTVALTSLVNPSGAGQPATFRAVVSGPGATPTGTVTFFQGSTQLGQPVALVGGVAQLNHIFPSEGTFAIRATYNGNGNYFSSNSNTVNQVVRRGVNITLSGSPNPSVVGGTVTFTATVAPASGGGTPSGVVTFRDGATVLGTGTLSGGSASYPTSALAQGSHAITAQYSGDGTFGGATSGAVNQVVNQGTPIVALALANPSETGTTRTFTVTVTGTGPLPSGNVQLYRNGSTLGNPAPLSNGTATITASNLPTGNSQSFFARYLGDTNYAAGDSNILTLNITRGVELTRTSPNGNGPWTTNTDFDFEADVVPTPNFPRGTVRLYRTSSLGVRTQIGSSQTPASNGEVDFNNINLPPGSWTISAEWTASGSNPEIAPSNTLSLTIPGTTSTSLQRTAGSSSNPYGDFLRYTATVSPNPGNGNGAIQLYVDGDPFGAPVNVNSSGQATFTPLLPVGAHTVYARYSGDVDTGYDPSQSGTINQTIVRDTPSVNVTLTSGTNPSQVGGTVTFTATVPSNGSGAAPTGNIQFYVDNVATGPEVPVGGATLTTTALARGDHTIRANYLPVSDPNYNSASGTRDHDVGFSTSISLSRTSPNGSGSVAAGSNVTLRARVSNANVGGGYPTPAGGTVTFLNGSSVIGTATVVFSSGNYDAVLTTNQLPTGSNNITARLEPNNAYNQVTSNTYNQVVRFSVSPTTVNRSPSGTRTITITGVGFVATPSISIDRGNCGGFGYTDGISGETVTSVTPTQLTVQFTISSSASRCSRDITVSNNGSSVTVDDAITIN